MTTFLSQVSKELSFSFRSFFADTTNKAQGKSFGGAIGLDLNHQYFTHGELYVAMSWVKNLLNICVFTKRDDNTTTNVVSLSVLATG